MQDDIVKHFLWDCEYEDNKVVRNEDSVDTWNVILNILGIDILDIGLVVWDLDC